MLIVAIQGKKPQQVKQEDMAVDSPPLAAAGKRTPPGAKVCFHAKAEAAAAAAAASPKAERKAPPVPATAPPALRRTRSTAATQD